MKNVENDTFLPIVTQETIDEIVTLIGLNELKPSEIEADIIENIALSADEYVKSLGE